MFVTFGKSTQHVSDASGLVLLVTGGRESTAEEAAECVNRLVYLGNAKMHEANEDFKQKYGRKA